MAYEFILRPKFGFFYVDDDYINYLKTVDANVCDNYDGTRAHVGVLIEVNNHKYIAPLTSPGKRYLEESKKHQRIVYPIDNAKLGYIRIGNMIPVEGNNISPIVMMEVADERYKDILLDQNVFLRKDYVIDDIRAKANELYTKRYNNDQYFLADIMCNFKKLEEACAKYNANKSGI